MTNLDYNGQSISYDSNGNICLTDMAKPYGKKVNDWARLKSTTAYLQALSVETGIHASSLLTIQHGMPAYGNPEVAIHFAQWLSPEFYVWCNINVRNLMEGKTLAPELHPAKDIQLWLEAADGIAKMSNPMLRSLMEQRMAENLTSKQLVGDSAQEGILTIRAKKLGYKASDIGNGAALGTFVVNQGCVPEGKVTHGRYDVNWYKITEDLDNAIKMYFWNKGIAI